MVKGRTILLIRMSIQDVTKQENPTATDNISGSQVQYMLVTLIWVRSMVKAPGKRMKPTPTATNTLVNTQTTKSTVKAPSNGRVAITLKGATKMIIDMGMGRCTGRMDKCTKAIGKWASNTASEK